MSRITRIGSVLAALCMADEHGRFEVVQRNMKWLSPVFTELSGKLGNVVGSSARGGVNYLRSRVNPSNPKSSLQTRVRTVLSTLAAYWRNTLTDVQRAAWTALAGDTESGIDVFLKCNSNPAFNGETITAAAPASPVLTRAPFTTCTIDASAHSITFDSNMGDPDIKGQVYASAPQRSSRLAQQFPFSFVGSIPSDDLSVAIQANHPAYSAVAGQIVYVKIVPYGVPGEAQAATVGNAQIFRCVVVA
jgi:hypothetical protein